MTEFIRIAKSTLKDYLRDEEINILKDQKFTAMLLQKKRITYGHSGRALNWPVRAARNGLTPYSDAQAASFVRLNREQRAEVPWRGYILSEAVTELERLTNRGREALVDYVSRLGEFMRDDLKYGFNAELYIDGTTSTNADRMMGLQSCLGDSGAAQYPSPDSTYAGLSTVLGNYGGALLSGSWPVGKFDPLYYFWSPIIADYTNSAWGASTNNWANNCIEVIRALIVHQRNLKGAQGSIDTFFMDPSMFISLKDALAAKERVLVERDGQNSGLVKAGFLDILNLDGVDLASEADCPINYTYGINFEALELCSMYDQLFDMTDMQDINTLSQKFVAGFWGNMKLNPRGLCMAYNEG